MNCVEPNDQNIILCYCYCCWYLKWALDIGQVTRKQLGVLLDWVAHYYAKCPKNVEDSMQIHLTPCRRTCWVCYFTLKQKFAIAKSYLLVVQVDRVLKISSVMKLAQYAVSLSEYFYLTYLRTTYWSTEECYTQHDFHRLVQKYLASGVIAA